MGGDGDGEEGRRGDGGIRGGAADGIKARSCKGCLYFSSIRKSSHKNPVCLGISRSLKQVPGSIVGESEVEISNDSRSLSEFKYACLGYSVYLDNKDKPTDKQGRPGEVPLCVGIEALVDKRATDAGHLPAHSRNKEDGTVLTPPRPVKPPHSVGEEFFGRFTRNAGLVASGVAKNLHKVGNYVKDNLDDILYPYRRRK